MEMREGRDCWRGVALSEAGFAGFGGIFRIVGDGAGAAQRILFASVRRAVRGGTVVRDALYLIGLLRQECSYGWD